MWSPAFAPLFFFVLKTKGLPQSPLVLSPFIALFKMMSAPEASTITTLRS